MPPDPRAGGRPGDPGRGRHHAGRHLPPQQPRQQQAGPGRVRRAGAWCSIRRGCWSPARRASAPRSSRPAEAPGAVLSLDVSQGLVTVPPDLATAGGQAASADGPRADLRQSGRRVPQQHQQPERGHRGAAVVEPAARHLASTAATGAPGWPTRRPAPTARGRSPSLDPNGAPLAGPPDPVAGGVFAGDGTNRSSASTEGLDHGAVAHGHHDQVVRRQRQGGLPGRRGRRQHRAGPRPQGRRRLRAGRDVPPAHQCSPWRRTQSTSPDVVTRVGMLFNWVPTRIAYVSDPLGEPDRRARRQRRRHALRGRGASRTSTRRCSTVPSTWRRPCARSRTTTSPATPRWAAARTSTSSTAATTASCASTRRAGPGGPADRGGAAALPGERHRHLGERADDLGHGRDVGRPRRRARDAGVRRRASSRRRW